MRMRAIHATLCVTLSCGVFESAYGQAPAPSTQEGTILAENHRTSVFDQLKAALDAQSLPSAWIDELKNDPPDIRFSDIGDNQGLYQPAWQGPRGNGLAGNTIHLKPGLNPLQLTSDQISTITHEAWHCWFDFVPSYPATAVSRFSDAQDEAIGGFIGELVVGNGLSKAVTSAINEATGENRGGTAQDAVDAIKILEDAWDGSFFTKGFVNEKDVRDWATLRRLNPEIQGLETYLSDADKKKLQDRLDQLERQRQADGEMANPVEPQSSQQSNAGPTAPSSDSAYATTTGGTPVSYGTGSFYESGGVRYPVDGGLALAYPGNAVAPWVNATPDSLNLSAASGGRAGDVQLMIVMFLNGSVPGAGRRGDLGRPGGALVASLEGGAASAIPLPQTGGTTAPLKAVIEALGVSSGEAFTIEISSSESQAVDLSAAGVVVEPLPPKVGQAVRKEFAAATKGEPTLRLPADGYCLEFLREPPPEGTMFRVAGPEVQKKFQPMRSILRAARQVLDAGGLTPDSDPGQYFHSIAQWALWTREQGFDARSFGEAFFDRTRKNFEAAGQAWTKPIQETVRALVPNRWKDVERILREAEVLDAAVSR